MNTLSREAIKKYALVFCEDLVNNAPTKRSAVIRLKKAINAQIDYIKDIKESLRGKYIGMLLGEKITIRDLENNELELEVMEYYLRFKLGYIYKG